LAALLHGTLVVGVSQTAAFNRGRHLYNRQGGHQAGHWPTFLVLFYSNSVSDSEVPNDWKMADVSAVF